MQQEKLDSLPVYTFIQMQISLLPQQIQILVSLQSPSSHTQWHPFSHSIARLLVSAFMHIHLKTRG